MKSTIIDVATQANAADVQSIYAPYVRETFITFETQEPSEYEIGRRIIEIGAKYPWLVAKNGDDVLGYAYASQHHSRAAYDWSVDVGIYIRADSHRRGIGKALYIALFDALRAQGFYNAYAGIALPNANSVRLHESMGFKLVGIYPTVGYKLGGWRDVGWWSYSLLPLASEPAPPTPFAELQRGSTPWRWKGV